MTSITEIKSPVAAEMENFEQKFRASMKSSVPLLDKITLRAFVDHSVIEVFVGDAVVLTARVYGDGPPASLVLPAGYGVVRAESHALSTVQSRGA